MQASLMIGCKHGWQLAQTQEQTNERGFAKVGSPKRIIDSLNRCKNRGLVELAHIAGGHEFINQPVSMWREDDSMFNQRVSLEN